MTVPSSSGIGTRRRRCSRRRDAGWVDLVDLVLREVQLDHGYGELAHRRQGLQGGQESALRPVAKAIQVSGLGKVEAVPAADEPLVGDVDLQPREGRALGQQPL